uniref:Uncharacterized protein n=1 Tax=Seriola dumerili TaxID=41447 RepID=A0A3B4UTB8_SERDU
RIHSAESRMNSGIGICRYLQLKARSSGNAVPALQSLIKYVPRQGPMDCKCIMVLCVIQDLHFYSEKRSRSHLFPLSSSGEIALTNFDTQRLGNRVTLPSTLLYQTLDPHISILTDHFFLISR